MLAPELGSLYDVKTKESDLEECYLGSEFWMHQTDGEPGYKCPAILKVPRILRSWNVFPLNYNGETNGMIICWNLFCYNRPTVLFTLPSGRGLVITIFFIFLPRRQDGVQLSHLLLFWWSLAPDFPRPNKYVLQTFGQHKQCLQSFRIHSLKSSWKTV